MKALFSYLFDNKRYKEIISLYTIIMTQYVPAYHVWAKHHSIEDLNDYKSKETIANSYSEIERVDKWLNTYSTLVKYKQEGLLWFLYIKGISPSKDLLYDDYKLIYENTYYIDTLHGYYEKYRLLLRNYKEAIERFLPSFNHSYEDIKKIALGENSIIQISRILANAHNCENKYKLAWNIFSQGRNFNSIPISQLESVSEQAFKIKNDFISLCNERANLLKVICSNDLLNFKSFDKETIQKEKDVFLQLNKYKNEPIKSFNAQIHLDNEKEIKRAILNSVRYGIDCNFSEDFTIQKFYDYRNQFDKIKISFDDAVLIKEQYEDAIKEFNQVKYGKSVVYISDYYDIVDPKSSLYIYVENYKKEHEKRNNAKCIYNNFRNGFKALYGSVNLDTCELSLILKIIESEENIRLQDIKINEQEKLRKEAERKLREEEERKNELTKLKSCVNSWPQPSRSLVCCFSLFYYYPTNCEWEASEEEWYIRNLIWDFKANPNKPQSEIEIQRRHEKAMNEIIPKIKYVLSKYFGSQTSKLTLVCVPSSKKIVTERRYRDFAVKLCSVTGMENGYNHVHILNEGEAKHLGGLSQAKFGVDVSYFKNKYVILFDDVITSGKSIENFKNILESAGAKVIAGLSIGKTKHEREFSHPIDRL